MNKRQNKLQNLFYIGGVVVALIAVYKLGKTHRVQGNVTIDVSKQFQNIINGYKDEVNEIKKDFELYKTDNDNKSNKNKILKCESELSKSSSKIDSLETINDILLKQNKFYKGNIKISDIDLIEEISSLTNLNKRLQNDLSSYRNSYKKFNSCETTFKEGLEERFISDTKVRIIYFTANWCVPCEMLEETTLKEIKKDEKNQNVYIINIDIDSYEGFKLKGEYKISSLPTLLFINQNNCILERIEETISTDKLNSKLKKYL